MPADTERLFFALWPASELRDRMVAATAPFVRAAGGRPIPAINYHVTLAFLGAVATDRRSEVIAAAADCDFRPFELTLDRTGCWPRSRIAWLGPPDCPPSLAALVDELWQRLTRLGFQRQERTYRPHVSLVRHVPPSGPVALLTQPLCWPVTDFVLAKSEPGATGPVYTVLEHFPAGN